MGQDSYFRSLPGEGPVPRHIFQQDKSPLAIGGYGHIFKANLDAGDGHILRVAMKVLKPILNNDATQTQELIKRLTYDARVWAKLRHSNVLPFLDCTISAGPSQFGLSALRIREYRTVSQKPPAC
ncbi:hypothetical protein B0H14DRAFT_1055517 [Mycena olivaceomarginata]|nr:hypothetical protein B0H14DRAFT_1055517 [Mycena olivaceomarginata]